jgi:nucleotide-binding universal stress UspA family protein
MSGITQTPIVPSFKNLLFATDFSLCSEAALPYVRAIAERYGSTVHIIHVLTPEPMVEVPLDWCPELDADRDDALAAMKTLAARVSFGKSAFTTTVGKGQLWDVLAGVIEEKSIDLIVLGTHGRRGLRKMLLGSVAEQVFRLASCPVLTVGPQTTHEGAVDANFATILYATDLSFGSLRALPYAASLARLNKSHLIVVHAIPSSMEIVADNFDNVGPATVQISAEFIADALAGSRRQVENLISAEDMQDLNPEIIVECGAGDETILRIANRKQADLIVMGAHRSRVGSIATHLPWATASEVVCQAHCPVLTVRS